MGTPHLWRNRRRSSAARFSSDEYPLLVHSRCLAFWPVSGGVGAPTLRRVLRRDQYRAGRGEGQAGLLPEGRSVL